MNWQTTNGITVEVATRYNELHSKPSSNIYVHSYHINIINDTMYPMQLLRRHWYIYDSNTTVREVEGDGVIGVQPIIKPGQSYDYSSFSPISTAIGKMNGYFSMVNLETKEMFKAIVPNFPLIANHKLN